MPRGGTTSLHAATSELATFTAGSPISGIGLSGARENPVPLEALSNGTRIEYDDVGRGEPALLFMPGWCANRSHFGKLVRICSTQRRCLAIDWPGHGGSGVPGRDFGEKDLVDAARAVIEKSGVKRVVAVSTAHAGWTSLDLWRQLGGQVEKIVLVDWLVLEPPPSFLEGLRGLQSRDSWRKVRDNLFSMWLSDTGGDSEIARQVERDMGSYGFDMWSRAGREIEAAYARHKTPLKALEGLREPPLVLHLYSIPKDEGFLAAQEEFAVRHSWFRVHRLEGKTHFPSLECPDVVAKEILMF